jgi:hypothetical protein
VLFGLATSLKCAIRDLAYIRFDSEVGVGERISAPRCIIAATEPRPKVAERAMNDLVGAPVVVLKDLLPSAWRRTDHVVVDQTVGRAIG